MYEVLLAIHNITRWLVLIVGLLAVIRMYIGWLGKHAWIPADPKIGSLFAGLLDLQLLLGLLLYFIFSPITRSVLQNFSAATSNQQVMFFAIEHSVGMLIAVVFAHLGSALSKRPDDPVKKHRTGAIWYTLAMIVILASIPWWRPLFPGIG